MTEPNFAPKAVLLTLNAHKVDYVVIGGLASNLLGAPIVTSDTDICYERSPRNLERLAAALVELDATLRVARVDEELPFILDAKTLAMGDSFTFNTSAGAVDVLATPSGTNGFRDLSARAASYDLGGGLVVRVVDIDDLIRMKEAAARLKDRLHLEELATLKEVLDEAKSPPTA